MIIGFDCETTPFAPEVSPELRLWCLYTDTWQVSGRTKQEFSAVLEQIWQMVALMKEDIVIVAHNLAFDYTQCIDTIPFTAEAELVTVIDSPSFASFTQTVNRRKYRLYFVDLMNYVQGTLENVAKAYGVTAKMDKNVIFSDDMEKLEEYCMVDARICFEVLTIIDPFYPKFRATASSLSYAILRQRSGWKPFGRPDFVKEAEYDSYFGGRTQPNYGSPHDYSRGWVRSFKVDINSQYPFIMKYMKVPVEYLYKATRRNGAYTDEDPFTLLETIYNSDDTTANVKCRVIMLRPCLPVRTKDGLEFPGNKAEVSGTWTIEEIWPAIRDREVSVIFVGAVFIYRAVKGMFSGFVDEFYDMKRNSGSEVKRLFAKLVMNGSSGKFGEHDRIQIDPRDIFTKNEIKYLQDQKYYVGDWARKGEVYNVLVMSGRISITQVQVHEARGACTMVISLITSGARRYLWEYLRDTDWIYCDTDSMIVHENSLIDNIGDGLGQWKVEPCITGEMMCDYQIKGKKDYRCRHEIKYKGIPKKDITGRQIITQENYESNSWTYTKVLRIKEALKRGLAPFSLIQMTKRRL